VGTLQYLLVTCPELSYFINKVAQFMHSPQLHHWQFVKCILRYLARTIDHGLLLHQQSSSFISDADWGVDPNDQKYKAYSSVFSWKN